MSTGGRGLFLAAGTFGHFSIDLSCALLLFSCFFPFAGEGTEAFCGMLAYNLIAFALQPLAGAFCDRRPDFQAAELSCKAMLAALVLGAVFAGFLPGSFLRWVPLVLCALANALFHAGAGREVLLLSGGELRPGGVFVSSGALGVSFGAFLGGVFAPSSAAALGCLCLLISLRLLKDSESQRERLPGETCFRAARKGLPFWAVLGAALLSVLVRSFVGGALPMEWKTGWLVLLPGAAAFLGKAFGGFFADRFGPRRVGVLALLLSLPLLCFGHAAAALSLAGLFFFNCTMPVSLGTVASLLPGAPGLAFGLTAQVLILGMLPLLPGSLPAGWAVPLSAGLILVSALCIFLSSGNELPEKKSDQTEQE